MKKKSEPSTSNLTYKKWITSIADKIRIAHTSAALKVNESLLQLYWEIGNAILEVQSQHGWGSKVIDNLSREIRNKFPASTGFSIRNLKYMRSFAKAYPEFPIVQVTLAQNTDSIVQVHLAQITWYHHISLLHKVKTIEERSFYIIQTAQNQWSRDVMLLQIKSDLYRRMGKAITNFELTLPDYQSDLAKSIFKDPYQFGFLGLTQKINERQIEDQLTSKITDFLLELGRGFAFIGKQYEVEVDHTNYKLDLLFYHTQLHCFVVVELKAVEFKPEFVSKLNFYISAIDDLLKSKGDNPTIGLLLCASKSNIKVEYAMRGLDKPLGVAEYELHKLLKDNVFPEENK